MKINKTDYSANIYNQRQDKLCTRPAFKQHKDSFKSQFSEKKKDFVQRFNNFELVDKKLLQQLMQTKDMTEYEWVLNDILRVVFFNYEKDSKFEKNLWNKIKACGKTTLAQEKYCFKIMDKKNRELVELFKFLSQKDENPEVIRIKNILIQKYGLKNVSLDNNPESAKLYLEAVKLLKEKNFNLPENIIISKYFPAGGAKFRIDGQDYIIINPNPNDSLWLQSTQSPIHTFIHEVVHCAQPNLLAFNVKKIPKNFKDTIDNMSIYASDNFTHEVHAELITKKILDGLTSEEEKLEKYIEN